MSDLCYIKYNYQYTGEETLMALIKCPGCNQNVSNKAKKCPHCGISIQEILNKQVSSPTPKLEIQRHQELSTDITGKFQSDKKEDREITEKISATLEYENTSIVVESSMPKENLPSAQSEPKEKSFPYSEETLLSVSHAKISESEIERGQSVSERKVQLQQPADKTEEFRAESPNILANFEETNTTVNESAIQEPIKKFPEVFRNENTETNAEPLSSLKHEAIPLPRETDSSPARQRKPRIILIKCPECNRRISGDTKICPHCGAIVQKASRQEIVSSETSPKNTESTDTLFQSEKSTNIENETVVDSNESIKSENPSAESESTDQNSTSSSAIYTRPQKPRQPLLILVFILSFLLVFMSVVVVLLVFKRPQTPAPMNSISSQLQISSSSSKASSAVSSKPMVKSSSSSTVQVDVEVTDKQEYIERYLDLISGEVAAMWYMNDSYVINNFEIKNNGNRTVKKVTITVYFYDENNQAIAENSVAFGQYDSEAFLLKPNYSFRAENNSPFYSLGRLPSTVDLDRYSIEITDIEFE